MEYIYLNWACEQNQKLLDEIYAEYHQKKGFLSDLDSIFHDLINRSCTGLQIKIRSVQFSKLFPFIAELHTARYFANLGYSVELLPDDYFKSDSPDVLIRKNKFECLVEVTYLSSSDPVIKIIQKLREFRLC